jgi:dTDP-4-amino-4,6-dideoxygalactose transaminase
MGEGQIVKIQLSKMYVDDRIRKTVIDVLDSGQYIKGQYLETFEQEFARFCDTEYSVGVSSGTSAILLTLMALGIGDGDEIIVPAHTFIATASPALFLGAKPVYVDIDPEIYTVDPAEVRKKISSRTKAIIPVHLYGHPCDMDAINDLAREYGLYIIEDACQAHGAGYKDKRAGSMGDAACFSFFPAKNMTVLGDGGMATTNNEELARRIRMLADHGRTDKYVHELLGLNFRMSEVHAAIGIEQLKHIEEWNEKRREIAGKYDLLLRDLDIVTPVEKEWARHVYYMYVIRVKKRDELAAFLKEKGIQTGIHYPVPLHRQPCVKSDVRLPVTEEYVEQILSLPMHPQLTDMELEYVATSIRDFMGNS